jgi:hypothetical protein
MKLVSVNPTNYVMRQVSFRVWSGDRAQN